MEVSRLLILLPLATALCAQTNAVWDSSGNSMLSGTFYFRQVVYSLGDQSGDLSDAGALYGNIIFDGKGHYTIAGSGPTGGAIFVDAAQQSVSPISATTGTYAIGGGGYGYITSPLVTGDTIFGLVSANGVFVGSSTDNTNGYNDMMIMAKTGNPLPTASSFTGSWTFSTFDPNVNYTDLYYYGVTPASSMISLIYTANPDGAGHFNAGVVKGYYNGNTQPFTQTPAGLPYIFSNGAAVATFPTNGTLVYGQKYFYFSADGNFLFGGSPQGFDMIVGVKTTSSPALSGLYFQAGLDAVNGDIDTYFGSFNAIPGGSPQTLLGHQRISDFGGAVNVPYGALYDYTYSNTLALSGNGAINGSTAFIAGAGGSALITSGINGSLGLSVALQAPTATGSGVYLNPQGVVNSASFAPFTARIAPGELITLFGSNLADKTAAITGGKPATSSLANVQVSIGGYPAPIFSVAPTQVSVIVPYEVTPGTVVGIQLTNSTGKSNTVTQIVSNTAPGVFTQCACGVATAAPPGTNGYGWIEHLGIGNSTAAVGSPVSDSNPALEGETLAIGLTGLGTVSPALTDGAVPSGQNTTTNKIGVDVSGTTATSTYSGLLPGFAGEYQINFTVPSTGITAGPNYIDVQGLDPSGNPDSYMSYLLIPVKASATTTTTGSLMPHRLLHSRKDAPAVRLPAKKIFSLRKPADGNQ